MIATSTAISLCSALIAAMSAFFAWRNSTVAGKKLQVDAMLAFGRETSTLEFRNAVRKVMTLTFSSSAEFSTHVRSLEPAAEAELTDQILLVTQFFDKIGFLVRKGHVDRNLVRAAYGVYIVEVWQHIKPILSESMHVGSDVYPNNLKWIAEDTMKTVKPYSEMQRAAIAAKFARIDDGTATDADRTFG